MTRTGALLDALVGVLLLVQLALVTTAIHWLRDTSRNLLRLTQELTLEISWLASHHPDRDHQED